MITKNHTNRYVCDSNSDGNVLYPWNNRGTCFIMFANIIPTLLFKYVIVNGLAFFSQIKHFLLFSSLRLVHSCWIDVGFNSLTLNSQISPCFSRFHFSSWTANFSISSRKVNTSVRINATWILRGSHLLDIISQENKVQIWRNCKLWGLKSCLWDKWKYLFFNHSKPELYSYTEIALKTSIFSRKSQKYSHKLR